MPIDFVLVRFDYELNKNNLSSWNKQALTLFHTIAASRENIFDL